MATGATPDDPLLPPKSHSFEPEFTGHPPRPIPDALAEGPHARGRRTAVVVLAVVGAVCLALSGAPGLDVLARYVLPLGYLQWIGAALLVLAGAAYVPYALRRGPFRYVRDGMPLAARVLDLVKTPTAIVNGEPSTYAFVALVGLRHPESGEAVQMQVKSNDFAAARKDAYDTPFKVGDTVTAVYFPGRLEKTLRLYAFLELSPNVHLRRRAAAGESGSPWMLALLLAAIPALFLVLFANVYAYGRYHPVDFEYRQAALPMAAGGVVLGGALFAALFLHHRAEQRRIEERSRRSAAEGRAVELATPFLGHGLHGWFMRAVVALGAPLVGAVTALCWCFMANAWLDTSPAAHRPATVTGATMKTYAFLFREYELEYTLPGSDETHAMLTTPEHLSSFQGSEAVASVRAGRLGWPWVETVSPRAASSRSDGPSAPSRTAPAPP